MSNRILKFYADWCAPCKALSTVMESMDLPYPVENINIDEEPEEAMKFNVRGIPCLVLVDEENNVLERVVGSITKEQILKKFGS